MPQMAIPALISSVAALGAAKLQSDATNKAIDVQNEGFKTISGALKPYQQMGVDALDKYSKLLFGDAATAQKTLEGTPGYQTGFKLGQKAVETGAAAKGGLMSGAAGKALVQFGTDYSNMQFDKELERLRTGINIGQTATSQFVTAKTGQTNAVAGLEQQKGDIGAGALSNVSNAVQGGFQNYRYQQNFDKLMQGTAGTSNPVQFGGSGGGYGVMPSQPAISGGAYVKPIPFAP